jgi:hypothetical protein
VTDEAVELDEAARVEEFLDALAGEELAALALARDGALVTGVECLLAEALQLGEFLLGRGLGGLRGGCGGLRLLGFRHRAELTRVASVRTRSAPHRRALPL